MKPKLLVRLSNIIGIISIILLVYWVFTFITIEVFGLRVFRQNMTETFYMSILGILALMIGSLIINIMFNLTRIADKQNTDDNYTNKNVRKLSILFILSFPLIFGLLVGGDYLTSRKKEKMLIESAESILNDHKDRIDKIADYSYSLPWLEETDKSLSLLSKTDKYFPHISVIVKDKFDESDVYLNFTSNNIYIENDTVVPAVSRFIMETTKVERDYYTQIFESGKENIRFSSHNGQYELFFPYHYGGKIIILYFSDYQRYGKMGS